MSFIVALFTDTSTELMSGAKSREWVHHNSTNQPTNQPKYIVLFCICCYISVFSLTLAINNKN